MKKNTTMDLTTGSVARKLLVFAIPIVLSNLLQHLYSAADRMVVGQFAGNGTRALAAVGATGNAISLLLGLAGGLSVGANIVCSNQRGAAKTASLRRSMHSAVILSLICGFVMMTVGIGLSEKILLLMQTPKEVLSQATLYMRIYFAGVPPMLLYNFGAAILRSYGDTRRPMIILMVSGLVNVVLNLAFVILLGMDVAGVALATLSANVLNAVWILLILFNKNDEFKLTAKEMRFSGNDILRILRIGLPCCLNGLSFNISNVILQSTINTFGEVVLAGNVAADGVGGVMRVILAGFYTACVSFAGQNYGAREYKRIDKGMVWASCISAGTVTALGLICFVFSRQMLGIFNSDPAVITAGTPKLACYCWGYGLFAVSEATLGCLRGLRKTLVPSVINVVGICLTRVLWIWLIFPLNPTINMVFLSYPISWGLSAAGLLVCYLVYRKKQFKTAAFV